MARFQYDKLNERQLRIAIGLLNQEGAVVEALEDAASTAVSNAIESALATFDISGLDGDRAHSLAGGASGGAREQSTKSAPPKKSAAGTGRLAGGRSRAGRAGTPAPARVSPAQLESRKLQGLYIAAIRSVPESRRARYKSLVKGPGGRQAAIDAIHHDYER